MNIGESRAERISKKNIRILERTEGKLVVQPHDDPSIKHEFDTNICPQCNVSFVENKDRGSFDADGNEDMFSKVCPQCGSRPC